MAPIERGLTHIRHMMAPKIPTATVIQTVTLFLRNKDVRNFDESPCAA
jgi:hypothetical protein